LVCADTLELPPVEAELARDIRSWINYAIIEPGPDSFMKNLEKFERRRADKVLAHLHVAMTDKGKYNEYEPEEFKKKVKDLLYQFNSAFVSSIESTKTKLSLYNTVDTLVYKDRLSSSGNKNIALPAEFGKDYFSVIEGLLERKVSGKLFLVDEKKGTIQYIYVHGSEEEQKKLQGVTLRVGGLIEEIIKNNEAEIIENLYTDRRNVGALRDYESEYREKQALIVPFSFGGLELNVKEDNDEYNEKDLKKIQGISESLPMVLNSFGLYQESQRLANTDGLTQVRTRRYLEERLNISINDADVYGRDLYFLLLDIDHFKKYNDEFGHVMGDYVLKMVGACLSGNCRANIDVVGRYGGEEFGVIFPNETPENAKKFAEKLRESIDLLPKSLKNSETMGEFVQYEAEIAKIEEISVGELRDKTKLTASIGVVKYETGWNVIRVMGQADDALYDSKNNGRNKVTYRNF